MIELPNLADYYDRDKHIFLEKDTESSFSQILRRRGGHICKNIDSIMWDSGMSFAMPMCDIFYPKKVIFSNEVITRTAHGDKTREQVLTEIDEAMKNLENFYFRRQEKAYRMLENLRRFLKLSKEDRDEEEKVRWQWDDEYIMSRFGDYSEEFAGDLHEWTPSKVMGTSMLRRVYRDARRIPFSYRVLGSYENGVITLYLRSICEYARERYVSPDTVFKKTFAHELFHLYHHGCVRLAGQTWNPQTNDRQARIVKESCAEYFSWLYVWDTLRDVRMMDLAEQDCLLHDYEIWPYSGAQYLEHTDGGCQESLNRVFKDSLCDWTEAYHDIVVYEHTPRIYPYKRFAHFLFQPEAYKRRYRPARR